MEDNSFDDENGHMCLYMKYAENYTRSKEKYNLYCFLMYCAFCILIIVTFSSFVVKEYFGYIPKGYVPATATFHLLLIAAICYWEYLVQQYLERMRKIEAEAAKEFELHPHCSRDKYGPSSESTNLLKSTSVGNAPHRQVRYCEIEPYAVTTVIN